MIELVPNAQSGQDGSWVARSAADAAAMISLGHPPYLYRCGRFLEFQALPAGVPVTFRADLPGQTEPQPA
jgi:hypothetical protein